MNEQKIRPARPEDAEQLLAIYAPYVEKTAITFEYETPGADEMRRRVEATLARYPCLAAERDGRVVGYACAGPFKERAAYDWAVETTVYVAEKLRRSGVGTALYSELERCLLAQGVRNLNACIAWPRGDDPFLTRDSAAFHERLGYREAAHFHACGWKFGRWYDMIWMEKLLGPHPAQLPPLTPFPELRERLFPDGG